MGTADVVPGVSGGTIAFIVGIYEKLIESINNINLQTVKYLFRGRIKAIEKQINLAFLLTLVVGVFSASFSLAKFIQYLLYNYEVSIWSFFMGLIIASILIVFRYMRRWTTKTVIVTIVGAIVAYFITSASVIKTPDTLLYVYLSGVIAIIAMILPGISGSFILLILDKYSYIIEIVAGIGEGIKNVISAITSGDTTLAMEILKNINFMPFLIFQLGTLTGIITFSKVLNWLFKRYHDITIASLIGFMIGSLNKVWPWKNTISTYTNSKGIERPLLQENILPPSINAQFFIALGLMVAGFFVVYYIEYISNQRNELAS